MKILQKNILQLICCVILSHSYSISKAQTYGQNGMVVSDNTIASQIGIDILKREEMR